MELIHYKLFYVAAIMLTGLLGGLIPGRTNLDVRSERFFSLSNALGGGVFLAAGLIHLFPDATANFTNLLGPELNYPLAAPICVAGFLLVLFLEKVLFGGHEEHLASKARGSTSAVYPYLLTLVLSVHSIIAGIALGVESQLATSAALFFAIIAHKGMAAFALGVSLYRGRIPRSRLITIIVLFSLMTPVGIISGAVLDTVLTGRDGQWFEGIFDALAAGTFLYVAVIDIIEGEFATVKDKWLKFSLVFLGVTVMAVVALWT